MMTSTEARIKNKQILKHEAAAKPLFGKEAKRRVDAYKKKGLPSTAQLVVDRLRDTDGFGNGLHVDVGCGSGQICFELLKNGARRTLGIDLSEEAINIAQSLAKELGHAEQAEFIAGSFIDVELNVNEPIQSIILHRVLCCHPDAMGILQKTVSLHPRHVFITLPTDNPIIRTIHAPIGVLTRLLTRGFQAQLHRHDMIKSFLQSQGYELVHSQRNFFWITYHFTVRHENDD